MMQTLIRIITTIAVLLLVIMGIAIGGPEPSMPRDPAEELVITIVARDMKFYVLQPNGDSAPNPTLRLAPGRTVVFILRNEDRGMDHDLVVEALNVRTPVLSYGQEARLTVTPPKDLEPGDYYCSIHPRSMRGRLTVSPR